VRVFIAAATGVIGRHLIPRLVQDGHQVAGMTRSPRKVAVLTALGATPVVCDAYDPATLTAVVRDSPSDVVIHLLTDLPARFDPRAGTTPTTACAAKAPATSSTRHAPPARAAADRPAVGYCQPAR
jgi:uncharacterized protein YbjT (DUF2867 family)